MVTTRRKRKRKKRKSKLNKEKLVRLLKKRKDVDNPWALANWIVKNHG